MAIGIILAAGSGTRFGEQSKLFVDLWGKPVLDYSIDLCKDLNLNSINIVVQKECEDLKQCNISDCDIHVQKDGKGTGAAVKSVISKSVDDDVLILLGDCPLVGFDMVKNAFQRLNECDLLIGGVKVENVNHAYGRIKMLDGEVLSVEESSVTSEKTEFRNAGWMICKGQYLFDLLSKIPLIKGEYYLTECVRIAKESSMKVGMIETGEDIGVNTKQDYVKAARYLQNKFRKNAVNNGCVMADPDSVYFSAGTRVESNVIVDPHVVFKGDVVLRKNSHVKSFSYVESSEIGNHSVIGPFAHIRKGTTVKEKVELGAFVETKNSVFESGSKAKHLSYIGDVQVGENVNIGAGSVFCNYDGNNKHKSFVGKNSFLGANATYVSPVKIGEGAQIGAGSVITKDVSSGKLAVSRSEQKEYKGKR